MKKIKEHIGSVFSLLFSFIPWIAYSLLAGQSVTSQEMAIVVALGANVILNGKKLRQGFILDWGTLIFFIALGTWTFFFPESKFLKDNSILSNQFIALIAWVSILVRRPFTLQYAKQGVPSYLWRTVGFLRVNYRITLAWALSFQLITLFQYGASQGWWSDTDYVIAEVLIYVLVVQFTRLYPDYYKSKLFLKFRHELPPLRSNYLQGSYAPVEQEIEGNQVVYRGEIPEVFNDGFYWRNGPNPRFEQFSYNYPFDGDGMIHGLYFSKEGQVSYRNRYVVTPELEAERKLGKAIYGSILDPIKPPTKLLARPDQPIKLGAFIHVGQIGNQLLALHEAAPAYRLSSSMETLGEWVPLGNGDIALPINAHIRYDAVEKTTYAISYDIARSPFLRLYRFDQQGEIVEEVAIEKDYPTMIHDFVMTKNYVVIIDSPAVFDYAAMFQGKPILSWRPELGVRIALIPRDNLAETPQWFESDLFFAYHFANACERDDRIEIIGAHYELFSANQEAIIPSKLVKTSIDIRMKRVEQIDLGLDDVEFMRVNDEYQGREYRYIYMPALVGGHFSQLIKYDDKTGEKQVRDFSGYELSEPVFVSEDNPRSEDDGYVVFFAYDLEKNTSEFYILKARDFLGEPQAVIKVPQRVPNGLHGNFFRR